MPADGKLLQKQLDTARRKVDVDRYDLTIREIIRMAADGELKIAPEYQRKFRWSAYDESRLIESYFLGLPVPSIFVATNRDSTWELVDGLQRVSTLIHFVSDNRRLLTEIGQKENLRLSGLEALSAFNKFSHADLPGTLQIHFQRSIVRVTALSDKSDKTVRFDLFERLNRGGIALSPQEVRACIYRGKYAEFLRDQAQYDALDKLVKLQKRRQRDGTREELVLKFFAYLRGRSKFDGDVKGFLNDYMEKAGDDFDKKADCSLFERATDHLLSATGGKAYLRAADKVTPLNALEACLVAVGEIIAAGAGPSIPAAGWIEDEELAKYTSKGTNSRRMLRERIRRAKELFAPAA